MILRKRDKWEGRDDTSWRFFADGGMVILSDPAWLQGAFSALVAIFDRVGLQTNVGKKVSMACHPCWAGSGNQTKAGYSWRVTGVWKTYAERQRERVAYGECGTVSAAGSMSSHLMTRHGKTARRQHLWDPQTNGGPRTNKMHFPVKGGRRRCPVKRFPGVLPTRAAMWVHFVHPHRHSCFQHPPASLHRASPPASFGREMHLIRPGTPIRLGGPEVRPCCGLPMLSNQMTRHGPNRDYRLTLPDRKVGT